MRRRSPGHGVHLAVVVFALELGRAIELKILLDSDAVRVRLGRHTSILDGAATRTSVLRSWVPYLA